MAKIDIKKEPTIDKVNEILENEQNMSPRKYLGMSQIGDECQRKLFYSFRHVRKRKLNYKSIRAISDGFYQEDLMIKQLKKVPGIELHVTDPENQKKQIGFELLSGHFCGHCDGIIHGIYEAPKTWHIWENKAVNEKKFNDLRKLKDKDEKTALEKWDIVYYAQAQIYMHCAKLSRHYLTVQTPGGRDVVSVRTQYNKKDAEYIIQTAFNIIFGKTIPAKLSEKPEFYKCNWCEYSDVCHFDEWPDVNCFSCKYIKFVENGKTQCGLSEKEIKGAPCKKHLFNPALINMECVENEIDFCAYKYNDKIIVNAIETCFPSPSKIEDLDCILPSEKLREKVSYKNSITIKETENKGVFK